MAIKPITLRRKGAVGYDRVLPTTKVEQITDLGTSGTSVFEQAGPTETSFAINGPSGVDLYNATDIKTTFSIANSEHFHPISQVNGLQDALDLKVPLDSSLKIPGEYFPQSILKAGVQFIGTADLNGSTGVTIREAFGITAANAEDAIAFAPNYPGLAKNPFKPGSFIIVSGVGRISEVDYEYNGITYKYVFTQLEAGGNEINVDDATTDLNILPASTTSAYLEVSDRVFLTQIEEISQTEFKIYFDVLNSNNSNYKVNGNVPGMVTLTSETTLANFNSLLKASYRVVDESIMRSAMRDIRYLDEFNNSTNKVFQYWIPTGYAGISAIFDETVILTGTGVDKLIYERQGGAWVQIGTATGFRNGTLTEAGAEGILYYDVNNDTHYNLGDTISIQGVSGYELETTHTGLVPLENDLVLMA
jgi:hypothetical protein